MMADTSHSRRDLWRAVIQQAIADATNADRARQVERRQARAWFIDAGPDFEEVCALADHEPSQVRRVALEHIADVDRRRAAGLPRKEKPTRKQTALITHNGETLPLQAWSDRTGLRPCTIGWRLNAGWSVEEALSPKAERTKAERPKVKSKDVPPIKAGFRGTPFRKPSKLITFDGQTLTVAQWAARLGIGRTALWQRLANGWPLERALTIDNVHDARLSARPGGGSQLPKVSRDRRGESRARADLIGDFHP